MRAAEIVRILAEASSTKGDVHSREIKDDSAEKGLVAIIFNNSAFPGAGVVPGPVAGTDTSEVAPSASCCFGIVHQDRVKD